MFVVITAKNLQYELLRFVSKRCAVVARFLTRWKINRGNLENRGLLYRTARIVNRPSVWTRKRAEQMVENNEVF